MSGNFMTVQEAIEIVLDLAVDNMISEYETDEVLINERAEQQSAIDIITDFVAHYNH